MSACIYTIWLWINSAKICDETYDTDSDIDMVELCGDEYDADTDTDEHCRCGTPPKYIYPDCAATAARMRSARLRFAETPEKYNLVWPAAE
jgi:hypothetical protein